MVEAAEGEVLILTLLHLPPHEQCGIQGRGDMTVYILLIIMNDRVSTNEERADHGDMVGICNKRSTRSIVEAQLT